MVRGPMHGAVARAHQTEAQQATYQHACNINKPTKVHAMAVAVAVAAEPRAAAVAVAVAAEPRAAGAAATVARSAVLHRSPHVNSPVERTTRRTRPSRNPC